MSAQPSLASPAERVELGRLDVHVRIARVKAAGYRFADLYSDGTLLAVHAPLGRASWVTEWPRWWRPSPVEQALRIAERDMRRKPGPEDDPLLPELLK